MPQKYRVTTDQGAYEVTVEDAPYQPRDLRGEANATAGMSEADYGQHLSGGTTLENVNKALEPLAHPQTATDLAGLAIPGGAGEAVMSKFIAPATEALGRVGGAVADVATGLLPKRAAQAVGALRRLNPTEWNNPLTVAGREGRTTAASQAFNDLPLSKQMEQLPQTPAPVRGRLQMAPYQPSPVAPAASVADAAAPAAGSLTAQERALLAKVHTPQAIDRIEQTSMAQAAQPMPSHTPESPLRQPRIDVGAERVGRAEGLTKEDVRTQAGPVLDEAVGEASPILPERALGNIIDKLKQLPKGGPEREAYVAAATSGKAKWQVENIRRTLEHLGLIVPAAAALSPVKDELMRRMRESVTGSGAAQ